MAAPFPDVQMIRQLERDQLIHLLESVPGVKDLVLEGELMRPLDRVAGASLLKEHGVDKIFKLDRKQKLLGGNEQRIYLVRPRMETMKFIADHINSERTSDVKRSYKILMVPRKTHVCEMILEKEGVFGDITIDDFGLDLIPLDRDVLSMEITDIFTSLFLHQDYTWLHTVASSLVNIQTLMGQIPNVYCLGKYSKMVHDLTNTMFQTLGEPKQNKSDIGHLFLIDRDVDLVTPLCSQLTYEGLLDDTFGLQSGFIEFGPEVTGKDQNVKLLLTSQDEIYAEVRDRHFSNVFGYLSSRVKDLQSGFDKRHQLQTVGDMKNYVANELGGLKQQHKAVAYHIGACEVILNKKTKGDFEECLKTEHNILEGTETRESISYIEECINRQMNLVQSLRLMCLLSLTQDGMSNKDYKSLKTQFLQSHGFEQMVTFHTLNKLGMLTEQDAPQPIKQPLGRPLGKMAAGVVAMSKKSPFQALNKKLNLVPKNADDVNLKSPNDMSYVFSGAYSPLSCKLVEQILGKEGFAGLDDVMKHIPGGVFSNVKAKSSKGKGGHSTTPPENAASRIVLVYFLGGCTYTEITALRFLGKQKGYRFLIATTAIINGNSLIESLMEKSVI